MTPYSPPPLREQLIAILIATLCAVCFLRSAVSPTRALLPFPPEMLQPMGQQAKADGRDPAAAFRGNLSMGDKYNQSLTWDRITQDRLRALELPLWTRDIAGGVPFVPQSAQVYHPLNLLLLVVPSAGIYGIWYLLHMVLMGLFAYRFLRRIEVTHLSAVFGMVTVVLGFWLQARVHHNVMLSAVLPLFPMLSCTHHLLVHRGGKGHVALLALATGLSWICGFAPASLMCTYLVSAYAVSLCVGRAKPLWLMPLLRFAGGLSLGICLASAQLLPTLFAAAETSRGHATNAILAARALETNHLATLLWPTMFNWPADHFYLPDGKLHNAWPALAYLDRELYDAAFNFAETAFYLGLAPLCMILPGLRERRSWLFGAAAAFGLLMALGWLLPVSQYLPGAHKGDVKRFVLLFGLCAPVVAAMGLDRVLRQPPAAWVPRAAFGLVALLSGWFLFYHLSAADTDLLAFYGERAAARLPNVAPGDLVRWIKGYEDEVTVQRGHQILNFASALAVALVGAAALSRLGRATAIALIAATALELVWLGSGTIVAIPTERVSEPPAILAPVLEAERSNGVRPRLHRLRPLKDPNWLNCPVPPNLGAFWGVEDLVAYSPLPKLRMAEFFLAMEPDEDPAEKYSVTIGGTGIRALHRAASLSHPLADLIGIEWILSQERVSIAGLEDRTPANCASDHRLYHRAGSMPRATIVHEVERFLDKSQRLARLGDRTRDPRKFVILEQEESPAPQPLVGDSTETVEVLEHRDQLVRIRSTTSSDAYLRLADPFDAGWTATINGESTSVYCADHYFRAVFLPAGENEIVFRYNGGVVLWPQLLSLFALLGVIALWLLGRRSHAASRSTERSSTESPTRPDNNEAS